MNMITQTHSLLLFESCACWQRRMQKIELFHLVTSYLSLSLIRAKNSSRDLGSSLRAPNMQLVTVLLLGFCTPRITIHICLQKKLLKSG